jgi:hypothetical protein
MKLFEVYGRSVAGCEDNVNFWKKIRKTKAPEMQGNSFLEGSKSQK